MTHKEKVNYLRIELSLSKIGVDNKTADRIICIYEGLLEKGGKYSIHDSVNIEMELDRKYAKKKLKT